MPLMGAAPPALRAMPEFSCFNDIAGQDSVIALLAGEFSKYFFTEDSNVAERTAIGPANCLFCLLSIRLLYLNGLFIAENLRFALTFGVLAVSHSYAHISMRLPDAIRSTSILAPYSFLEPVLMGGLLNFAKAASTIGSHGRLSPPNLLEKRCENESAIPGQLPVRRLNTPFSCRIRAIT